MNKKIVFIPIIIIAILIVNFSSENPKEEVEVFHITLADPDLYVKGEFSETVVLENGTYSFRFVPNGSSPEILSISLKGEKIDFSENFILEKTLHDTGISEYYTWHYNGQKEIVVSEIQQTEIRINPNGDIFGSVSVDILEN